MAAGVTYTTAQLLQAQAIVDQMIEQGIAAGGGSGGGGGSGASLYEQVLNSNDLIKTIQYYDAGTPDERIFMITLNSAISPIEFYDEYVYEGATGNYRVIQVKRTSAPPSIPN